MVKRDDGQGYEAFLIELAKAEGIETQSREDIARLDRNRPKKGSNDVWVNPHEPDAQISKMTDGATDMAHKVEHAVDMAGGAIVAVTLHGGTTGDTTSLDATLEAAAANLTEVREELQRQRDDDDDGSGASIADQIEEAVAAYKAIDPVIDVQVEAGIVAPVARRRPLLTFKA